MTSGVDGSSRPSGWRANIRSLLGTYAFTALVVGLMGTAILLVADRAAWSYGLAAVIVGIALSLSGGSLLGRMTTLDSSKWGVDTGRHRRDVGREYSDTGTLTPLGVALLVGIPAVLLGAALMV